MRQQIARRPGASFRVLKSPCIRADGIGPPALEIRGPVMINLAQPFLVDQSSCKGNGGNPAIIKPHEGRYILRRPRHTLSFLDRHGKRFFAKHYLACLSSCNGNWSMQIIGSANVNNVDVFSLNYSLPIAGYFVPAPARGSRFKLLLIAAADDFELKVVGRFTKMTNLMKSIGVSSPHKPLAYHRDVELLPRVHTGPAKTLRKDRMMSSSSLCVR